MADVLETRVKALEAELREQREMLVTVGEAVSILMTDLTHRNLVKGGLSEDEAFEFLKMAKAYPKEVLELIEKKAEEKK